MSNSAPALLSANAISKVFSDGDVRALVDVSLTIEQGEFLAITGPSGCGKSTLLGLLGALDTPTSGTIAWRGIPLAEWKDLDALRAREIGFVFQSFYLIPTLTALENVQIPMFEREWSRRERAARAEALLHRVGLGSRMHNVSAKLSIGERQRVAIARAIANEPRLLFADEPTGNLDSANAAHILDLFREIHDRDGVTLVLVTHSAEVAAAAHRHIRLRDGRVVADERSMDST